MNRIQQSILTIVFLAVGASAALSAAPGPNDPSPRKDRRVKNNVIISEDMPAIRIEVNKAFKHVGNMRFNLKDIAAVERVIFVDGHDRGIKRMLIVQFEGFLEGVDDYYKYSIENPITLGGDTYRSNAWFYSNAEAIRENPGAESDRTTQFLSGSLFSILRI